MIMNKKQQSQAEMSPKFLLVVAISVLILMVAVYLIGAQFRGSGDGDADDGIYGDTEHSDTQTDQNGFPNETDGENTENGEENDDPSKDDVTDTEKDTEEDLTEPETEPETEEETETEKVTETEPPKETEPPETDPPKETEPPETKPPKETEPPETDPPETKPPETKPPETDPPETDEPAPTDPPVTDPPPEKIPSESVMLFVDGVQCSLGAVYKGDTVYVPLGVTAAMIDSGVILNCVDNGEKCTITADGISITAEVGDPYIIANGRYLPCADVYSENGIVMVAAESVAKAFGAAVSDVGGSVYISAKTGYIKSDEDFYDVDQLYWLSRLISAEAKNEPFDGKLAVGAVVMNRIRSSEFPNTMYEVLFEKNQFSTVDSEAFYRTPSKDSVIAAKMCLEGYLYDSRILFFDSTYDSWAQRNREFRFKLGDHYFYA